MSCCSKEKMERNDCNKNQLTKSDREMFRVCPSKLSKRELEDLYFTLLEDNLELKKTVNKQQDKIRVLSTQVQRLTNNQQKSINKEMKECCTGTKAFVNEQKDFITELKETNQRLAERIQQLNLRLSSAKQFMKGSPPQAASARPNAPLRNGTPKKHDCLNKVQEAPPPNSPTSVLRLSTFSQWEDRSPKISTQTSISGPVQKSPKSDQTCDENKCRSLMEELKLKVVTLQEELGIVHTEYSTRISRLETEVSEVRKENVRVNGERSASEHELQNSVKQNSDILARFRSTEAKCAELTAELSIEKRKVAELETLLKASNMTDKINKTLEDHLTTLSETEDSIVAPKERKETVVSPKETAVALKQRAVAPKERAVAPKEKAVAPKERAVAPKEKTVAPKERAVAPKETAVAPKEKTVAPKERAVAPKETAVALKETIIAPNETAVAPKETIIAPNETVVAPKEKVAAPKETVLKSKHPVVSSKKPVVAPNEIVVSSIEPVVAPKETIIAPNETVVSPKDKVLSLKETGLTSKQPDASSKKQVVAPKETVVSSKEPVVAPKETVVAPKDTVVASKETVLASKETVISSEETVVVPKETVVAQKETDQIRLILCCGCRVPSEIEYGMPEMKNWLPVFNKKKETEDPVGKRSPTKYMPSGSSSSASKTIKVENASPTKQTLSKDLKSQDKPPNLLPKDLSKRLQDREKQEHTYPPSKELSSRPEDRKNQEYPYPPPKDFSTKAEVRKTPGYPSLHPNDLSTQAEDRKKQEHTYPPPKDMSTRPENRKTQYCPNSPPKDVTTRLDDCENDKYPPVPSPKDHCCTEELKRDRRNQEFGPKSLSAQPEEAKCPQYPCTPPLPIEKSDFCGCASYMEHRQLPEEKEVVQCGCVIPAKKIPLPSQEEKEVVQCGCVIPAKKIPFPSQYEYTKCKTCCFPDMNLADNGNVTSPTGVRTRFSPTKEIADIKPKLPTKTADIPQYHQDSEEKALLKQNEHLLLKILELQNQKECMKKRGIESPEVKLTRLTSVDSPPLYKELAEDQLTCVKCCYKDKPGTADCSPSKKDKTQTPRDVQTRPSPTKVKDDPKSTSTADDSGYQDCDEMGLQKMNKDLLQKVLELQNQIDCLKIGVSQKSEAPQTKMQECIETSKKSIKPAVPIEPPPLVGELKEATELPETKLDRLAYAHCNSPPFLGEILKVEKSVEQIEPTLPFPNKASEERLNRVGKILKIEVLGSPTHSDTSQRVAKLESSEDTRAKTVQGSNGTLLIPEELSPNTSDEYIVDYDSPTEDKTIPKLTITEKKKNEVIDSSQPDIVSVSAAPRLSINPEKLKYLENEGVLAKSDLEKHMAQFKENQSNGSESITESVPSNPELGFGIPRLARKQSVIDELPKKSQQVTVGTGTQRARNNDYFEDDILPGKLKLPVTETLTDKLTAPRQTDETKKQEDCQYCAACSFDKECELKHNLKMNKLALGMQKELCKNNDLQKVLQIPHSIPISDNKKDKKKNMFCHFIKDATCNEKTGSLTKEETLIRQKIRARRNTGFTLDGPGNVADVPLLQERENNYIHSKESLKADKKILLKAEQKESPNKKDTRDGARWTEEGSIVCAKHTCNKATDRVNLPDVPLLAHQEKKELIEGTTGKEEVPLIEVKPPTAKVQMFSERMLPILDAPTGDEVARVVEHAADMAECAKDKPLEKASQAPTTSINNADAARNKEMGEQRDVSMYRRRSGTVCLRSVQPAQEPRVCTCAGQRDGYCTSHPKSKGVQVKDNEALKIGTPRERYRQSTSERGTYTVGSNKIDAPDTDNEMSYFSDLPMENEKKSPVKSRPLSPGEDRTLTYTTTTRSDDSRTTDALSEGEMQPSTSKRYTNDAGKTYLNTTLPHTPPAQQMEAALNAISHELRHCKNLLHANRPAEHTPRPSCASQTPPSPPPRSLALRPAPATPEIGDAHAPCSIFTLHIGTVVLCDEAVLYSRDKNLVLKWRFYNQAVTMARMRAGRVVVFDFSTQYDINVTEDFLNYLRHAEMTIVICESDSENYPFAISSVPLRDALLHANTRADMSVALLAGPQLRDARAPSGSAGAHGPPPDEVGVIDLWCMLKADANLVPGINLVMAQPAAASKSEQPPGVLQQEFHDYNELDIGVGKHRPAASHQPTGKNQNFDNVEYIRTSTAWQQESKPRHRDNSPWQQDKQRDQDDKQWYEDTKQRDQDNKQWYQDSKQRDQDKHRDQNTKQWYQDSKQRDQGKHWDQDNKQWYQDSKQRDQDTKQRDQDNKQWYQDNKQQVRPQTRETDTKPRTNSPAYDASKYPPIRERNPVTNSPPYPSPLSARMSSLVHPPSFDSVSFKNRASDLIINEVNARIKLPGDIAQAAGRNRVNDSRSRILRSDDELASQVHSSYGSLRSVLNRLHKRGSRITHSSHGGEKRNFLEKLRKASRTGDGPAKNTYKDHASDIEIYKKYENIAKTGSNKSEQSKKVTIMNERMDSIAETELPQRDVGQDPRQRNNPQQQNLRLDVTILWLALNEECEAMIDPYVQRVYVAYTFLGRHGAELETPISLPKPKHYVEKCYFNFKKTFELEDTDISKVAHMARCRASSSVVANENDCIIFTVISEPPEDPLGIESCEDIGYAFLYLGDLLAYSAGSPGYTEVIPVRAAAAVCGVLAVRLDGLDVVRRCLMMTTNEKAVRAPS